MISCRSYFILCCGDTFMTRHFSKYNVVGSLVYMDTGSLTIEAICNLTGFFILSSYGISLC